MTGKERTRPLQPGPVEQRITPSGPDSNAETDELVIRWTPDGRADFFPTTFNPERLATRFAQLLLSLASEPELIAHAAGYCTEVPA